MPKKIVFEGRLVGEIYDEISQNSDTPHEKGRDFENLFQKAAPHIPDLEVRKVWLWKNWPDLKKHGLNAKDDGIDLVAELKNGKLVAVQCKNYSPDRKVSKQDIQSFITGAKPDIFSLKWFVATAQPNKTAEGLLGQHHTTFIDFNDYRDIKISQAARPKPLEPWPLQARAIDRVCEGLANDDRGRLIMACGTGKTFTALRIAERLTQKSQSLAQTSPPPPATRLAWRHADTGTRC